MIVRFNPPTGWPQKGRAFNHGVVEPQGRRVHITGQVAWDADGNLIGGDDVAAQAEASFENVKHILAAIGGRLSDIVSMTVYVVRADDIPAVQKVRAAYIKSEEAPASIFLVTPGLVSPDLLVELVPIAVIPEDRYRDPPTEMQTV